MALEFDGEVFMALVVLDNGAMATVSTDFLVHVVPQTKPEQESTNEATPNSKPT